jgi:hypothetical protein
MYSLWAGVDQHLIIQEVKAAVVVALAACWQPAVPFFLLAHIRLWLARVARQAYLAMHRLWVLLSPPAVEMVLVLGNPQATMEARAEGPAPRERRVMV